MIFFVVVFVFVFVVSPILGFDEGDDQ